MNDDRQAAEQLADSFGADLRPCNLPSTPDRWTLPRPFSSRKLIPQLGIVTCPNSHTVDPPEHRRAVSQVYSRSRWENDAPGRAGVKDRASDLVVVPVPERSVFQPPKDPTLMLSKSASEILDSGFPVQCSAISDATFRSAVQMLSPATIQLNLRLTVPSSFSPPTV